jgi:hypothetical protein
MRRLHFFTYKNSIISKWFCVISFIVIFSSASAQESNTGNTVKQFYTELGGPGILFSANMDSRFKALTRLGWGFRAGFGFTLVDQQTSNYGYRTRSVATFPLGINYLFGKSGSPHMFEVGGGVTILSRKSSILNYNERKEGYFLGHFDFMYRRQPPEGGFCWRIGMTPLINPDGDIVPFGAVGLGFSFK